MLHQVKLPMQDGSIDTEVANSYYIHLDDPTQHGSMDTEVTTSYYTLENPPSMEVISSYRTPGITPRTEIST